MNPRTTHLHKGNEYYNAKNYKAAIGEYKKQLKSNVSTEQKAQLYHYIGDCHEKKGESKLAEDNLLRAIELNPLDSDAYKALGEMYFFQGNLEKAITYLEKTSDYALSCYRLGLAYYHQNNFEKAIEYFLKAIQLSKDEKIRLPAYFQLGMLYLELDKKSEAKECLSHFSQLKNVPTYTLYTGIKLRELNLEKKLEETKTASNSKESAEHKSEETATPDTTPRITYEMLQKFTDRTFDQAVLLIAAANHFEDSTAIKQNFNALLLISNANSFVSFTQLVISDFFRAILNPKAWPTTGDKNSPVKNAKMVKDQFLTLIANLRDQQLKQQVLWQIINKKTLLGRLFYIKTGSTAPSIAKKRLKKAMEMLVVLLKDFEVNMDDATIKLLQSDKDLKRQLRAYYPDIYKELQKTVLTEFDSAPSYNPHQFYQFRQLSEDDMGTELSAMTASTQTALALTKTRP